MEIVLGTILSYLIGLAANLRTDAILARREERLREQLGRGDGLRKALASSRPLRDELRDACAELARNRDQLGVTPQEKPLWRLLGDEVFQADLAEWLMAGGIEEGNAVKNRLVQTMDTALANAGAKLEQRTFLKTSYFDALDKVVFAHPILAHWRHQLSLDYLREQVAGLRRRAEEAAGVYSLEKQRAALDRYCEKVLGAWDIIDLSNLPEGDIHMATQKLLLRQLYMPLRIKVELTKRGEGDDAMLARLEEQREARRHREAGHLFADEPDRPDPTVAPSPVGHRLGASRRLVVLGDPGGGKTTMLRWMATAYLLRYKGDDAFSQIPDTETLPSQAWIPVLIRCRDLGEADLCRSFTDFLTQHLNKTELLPAEADIMRAVILDRVAKGEALLLVDGLDEITNSSVRMMFCQELERTAARYPGAPMVVTSRIVGYRDTPYRMGASFEHGVIAELNREDQDLFAQRWVEVTEQHQPAAEKAKRVQELLCALHSSDRIERLTGNPMLLTVLALVKRKVGKLPNRRNKLYAEAVSVLLNWNPRLYQTIEEDEAIPQLEYLAHEMCRRGVQRLTDDEVLDLLDRLRTEYPHIRALRRRDAQAFLKLLEARSSILVKSGAIWQKETTQQRPVWEFRHLTFQEYLAARALLDGRYPDRDKTKSLAEQVTPLAGAVKKSNRPHMVSAPEEEVEVPESWREALRLLVADCKDDDVDEVLLAILCPMACEDANVTGRPRAVLAALCLADEPNVSEESAQIVLAAFAGKIGTEDGAGVAVRTSLERAAVEIGGGIWAPLLKKAIIQEFCQRSADSRWNPGALWGMVEVTCWTRSAIDSQTFFTSLVTRLGSEDRFDVLSAALTIMEAAYEGRVVIVEGVAGRLLALLEPAEPVACYAAAWALRWLAQGSRRTGEAGSFWVATGNDVDRLCRALESVGRDENSARRSLVIALGFSEDSRAVLPLLRQLDHADGAVRIVVVEALARLGDKQAVPPLMAKLDDPDGKVRNAVVESLGQLGDKQAVPPLIAKLDDPDGAVRTAVVEALTRLADTRAVPPLIAKLDDPDAAFRATVLGALVRLGDKQAIRPLLAKLDDGNANFRLAVIESLGQWGDKQATEPLMLLLEDRDDRVCAAAAAALTVLGTDCGSIALRDFLDHNSPERRRAAIRELVRIRGKPTERVLLSRDLDGEYPWLDPSTPITETRIAAAAQRLGITNQKARSLYESIAGEFHLKFA